MADDEPLGALEARHTQLALEKKEAEIASIRAFQRFEELKARGRSGSPVPQSQFDAAKAAADRARLRCAELDQALLASKRRLKVRHVTATAKQRRAFSRLFMVVAKRQLPPDVYRAIMDEVQLVWATNDPAVVHTCTSFNARCPRCQVTRLSGEEEEDTPT